MMSAVVLCCEAGQRLSVVHGIILPLVPLCVLAIISAFPLFDFRAKASASGSTTCGFCPVGRGSRLTRGRDRGWGRVG